MQSRWCASLVTACQHLAQVKPHKCLPLNTMAKPTYCHYATWPNSICQAAAAASRQTRTRQSPSYLQTEDRPISQLLQSLQIQVKQACRGHCSVSHSQLLLCNIPFRSLTHNSTSAAVSPSGLKTTLGQRLCRQSGACIAGNPSGAPGENTSTAAVSHYINSLIEAAPNRAVAGAVLPIAHKSRASGDS